jgi:hypothetical protein
VKEVEVVLTIPITTDDRNLLGRGDVVAWENSGRLCESEEFGEDGREDVNGESSAHMGSQHL